MGVDHKLLLQLFLIGLCYRLDYERNFNILPGNPQQILTYSWHIFKSSIKSIFQIQNTIRLF